MNRGLAFAGVVTVCLGGCFMDQINHYDRPARLEMGVNSRHFAAAPAGDHVALRTTTAPEQPTVAAQNAVTASAQFTMATPFHTYLGGEIEAGKFADPGSNVAAGYAIIGARNVSRFGSIGVEVAAGWRSLRSTFGEPDVTTGILEPRVRGQLWLSPQIALGGAAGATLGEQGVWMAGVYIGFASHLFGTDH